MTQHYPHPDVVSYSDGIGPLRLCRQLTTILKDQGQIVPLLVHDLGDGTFRAADTWQDDRLRVLKHQQWPSILVETEWTEDDL